MAITKAWNIPQDARKNADPSTWYASYPNPADLNFNYRKLLEESGPGGVMNVTDPDFQVAVVGAGVAGLTAARELLRCGCRNIDLYEATARYGGRHYTKTLNRENEPPASQQYTVQEGGAMRMPPFLPPGTTDPKDGCSILSYYMNDFMLGYEDFPNPGSSAARTGIYYNDGYQSGGTSPQMLIWETGEKYPPSAALKQVYTRWQTFVNRIVSVVKNKYPTGDWPQLWQAIVQNYWNKTFRDVVLEKPVEYSESDPVNWGGAGMSEDEATLFYIIGAGDGSWGAFFNLGFLYAYRTFIHGFSDNLKLLQGTFDHNGSFVKGPHYQDPDIRDANGNKIAPPPYLGVKSIDDCLLFYPTNSAAGQISLYDASQSEDLEVNLYFNSPVVGLNYGSEAGKPFLQVNMNSSRRVTTQNYDAIIMTVPTWMYYTDIQVSGFNTTTQWPFDLQTYLKRAHWEPCCKIFVGLKEPYWENRDCKIPQCIATDSFLQDIYGVKVDKGGSEQTGTLLLSYTWWRDANKLVSYSDEELTRLAIEEADRILMNAENIQQPVSPYIDTGKGYVIHWESMPTYKGAARLYDESTWADTQVPMTYNQLHSAASRVYFAGESYGVDAGWTEPAFRSAIDAVLHIANNNQFNFNAANFTFATDYPKYNTSWQPTAI